jgi:hypothetical protein
MLEMHPKYTCTCTRVMALADVLDSPANNTKRNTIIKHYKRAHIWAGTR